MLKDVFALRRFIFSLESWPKPKHTMSPDCYGNTASARLCGNPYRAKIVELLKALRTNGLIASAIEADVLTDVPGLRLADRRAMSVCVRFALARFNQKAAKRAVVWYEKPVSFDLESASIGVPASPCALG